MKNLILAVGFFLTSMAQAQIPEGFASKYECTEYNSDNNEILISLELNPENNRARLAGSFGFVNHAFGGGEYKFTEVNPRLCRFKFCGKTQKLTVEAAQATKAMSVVLIELQINEDQVIGTATNIHESMAPFTVALSCKTI